ncbi:MAG: HtaA domain-containing protein [Pseudomonadales bacterium]|jgi:hypothetical protein
MSFKQLTWGVKASFRGYVEAAGGTIKVSDGASQNEEGAIVFAAIPGGDLNIAEDGTATGAMRFQGTVQFEAHGGMLNSTLADLGVEAENGELFITVLEAPMNEDRCAIAKLTLLDTNGDGSLNLKSEITMDGMYQIADNYPPGTELDPVILT